MISFLYYIIMIQTIITDYFKYFNQKKITDYFQIRKIRKL